MKGLPGVRARDHALLCRILRRHFGEAGPEVFAFGSRTTRKYRESSDLDLLVRSKTRLPPGTLVLLHEALEESDLPFRVDLREESALAPHIRENLAGLEKSPIRYGEEATLRAR